MGEAVALRVEEIAWLGGGDRLVAASALVALHEQETMALRDDLVATRGKKPPRGGGVEQAIWRRLRSAGPVSGRRALALAVSVPEVLQVQDELAARGYARDRVATERQRRLERFLTVLGVLAGLLAAMSGALGAVLPAAVALVGALLAGAGALVVGRARPTTAAGDAALAAARDEHALLADGGLPGDRGLAVALFGPDLLWSTDASMAAALQGFSSRQARSGHRRAPVRRPRRSRTTRRSRAAGLSGSAGGSWWAGGDGGSWFGGGDGGGSGHHSGGHHSCGGHSGCGSSCGGGGGCGGS